MKNIKENLEIDAKANKINWIVLLIFSFFQFSCSKSTIEKVAETEIYQSSIKTCVCSAKTKENYKIEATINGEKVCFDKLWYPNSVSLDLWMQTFSNEILTERVNGDSTVAIRIQYNNPSFKLFPLPYKVDSLNVKFCEAIQIEIINLNPLKLCSCPTDDSYYTALSSISNLSSQIVSYSDNIIEGTFEGDFMNRGGKNFKVTNGYFKIKLAIQK